MKLKGNNWQTFVKELQRRKVVQVVLAYIAFSWLLIQVADVAADAFETPSWLIKALFIVLVVGLPVTGVISWIFDITSKGIEKTKELPHPNILDIKSIPIIFHASFDELVTKEKMANKFRDYILWSDDFNAVSSNIYEQDCMILFSNSIDAMRFAIRIQNHSQSLDLPLNISIIEAPDNYTNDTPASQKVARARALAIDSQLGAVIITKAVKKAIKNRGVATVENALRPLLSAKSKIQQEEYIIDPEQIHLLNAELKEYSESILYYKTPVTLKLASLLFLTVIAGLLWSLVPTLETSNNATISILPFKNISTNNEHQNFTQGLSEDIFNNISNIPDLNVISRRSSQALSDSKMSIQEIGKLLKADWVVEGSINRSDDNVRVSMWITDSESGIEQWNDILNLSSNDLLAGNKEILKSLSQFLDQPLDTTALVNVSNKPRKDLYPKYLQAKGILKQPRQMELLKTAEQLLKNIIKEQESFSPAIAALCQTYFAMYSLKFEPYLFDLAEQECSKTYQKESKNVETLLALASLHSYKGNYRLSEQYISEAQKIDPSDVEVLYTKAWIENKNGAPELAIDYLNQALLVEPNYWRIKSQLGVIYLSQGKWQKAIDAFKKVVELIPEHPNGFVNLGNAYFFQAEFDKAALAYQEALKFKEDDVALSNIATMWFYHGDFSKAANYYLKAIKKTPKQYLYWLNLADTKDQGVEYKEEALSHYEHTLELAFQKLSKAPNDADARAVIAWCYAKIGNDADANSNMLIALNLSPKDPNILYLAAKTSAQLGNVEQGKLYLQQSIDVGFPESVLAISPIAKNLQLYPL